MSERQTAFVIGDRVRWKSDQFGYYGDMAGVVARADIPIAVGCGWQSHGVIAVDFPNGCQGQSHWSNFKAA